MDLTNPNADSEYESPVAGSLSIDGASSSPLTVDADRRAAKGCHASWGIWILGERRGGLGRGRRPVDGHLDDRADDRDGVA